ncbi:MAG: FAD-dependent oxidoreductase [SAR324 cluster bacterium]|nr:FAD-dependent oxidoreductase [SAR324 cluster bacterium]
MDTDTGTLREIKTGTIINATGAWAEGLHPSPKQKLHIRPLRGSHLIFPHKVLPVNQAVSFVHPKDNRPVFAFPWEGVTLFGTTDVDHGTAINTDPSISKEEVDYLMEAVHYAFPQMNITSKDCLATLAGVRPVLSEGKANPSEESREHLIWVDKGLVTVTGGKLTTFRKLAVDTLKEALEFLPVKQMDEGDIFDQKNNPEPKPSTLTDKQWKKLKGRYGLKVKELIAMSSLAELTQIPGTETLWAELRYTAKNEQIRHLSDLLLRRVRLGLLLPEGGKNILDRVRELCGSVLEWDEERWQKEINAYQDLWQQSYSMPQGVTL